MKNYSVWVVGFAMILSASALAAPVKTGIWGGTDHSFINMTVRAEGADIEFSCGSVRIDHRLDADEKGNFRVSGLRYSGIMVPHPIGVPVQVMGTVTGNSMNLLVEDDSPGAPETFTLGYGKKAFFAVCK